MDEQVISDDGSYTEEDDYESGEETHRYGHDYSRHISRDYQYAQTRTIHEKQPQTFLERLWTTGTVKDY